MLGTRTGVLLICIKPGPRGARFHHGMRHPSSARRHCENPEQSRREELARALHHLHAGADPARVLEQLSQRLTNKLLHQPTKAIT
jgi:glutamyl-tRNA reductase